MVHKICFYGEIWLIIPVTLSYLEHWMVLMRAHNICFFMEKFEKLSWFIPVNVSEFWHFLEMYKQMQQKLPIVNIWLTEWVPDLTKFFNLIETLHIWLKNKSVHLLYDSLGIYRKNSALLIYPSTYSRTSMARTPLGPWKLVRDRGSWSQWGLIIAPDQEAL